MTDWDAIISIALRIFAVLVLVVLNGFFVAAEFALVKVRDTQLSPLIKKGQRRAKAADYTLAHRDGLQVQHAINHRAFLGRQALRGILHQHAQFLAVSKPRAREGFPATPAEQE